MRLALVVATFVIACAESDTTRCGTLLCPAGTSCVVLPALTACATDDQRAACDGKQENDACTPALHPPGVCHGGACFAPICGDGLVDPGELCDVATTVAPDRCSADCRTDFACGNGVVDPGEVCDDTNPFSHDGCSSGCAPEAPRWRELRPVQLDVRAAHAMAFDGIRGTVLLFGGLAASQALGDTLAWDGATWVELASNEAPRPRSGHAMASDARRGRVVLFGGALQGASTENAETWEWDGTRWQLRFVVPAPSARQQHAIAYDAGRDRIVMFGGRSRNSTPDLLADTLEWDGVSWKSITTAIAPPPRAGHAMAYDAIAGVVVLFGGTDGAKLLADTWTFDGTTWTERTPVAGSPPPQQSAALVFDGTRTLLIGGADGSGADLEQTWAWNGQAWSPVEVLTLRLAAAAFDPLRNRAVIFGESTIGIFANQQTYEWDPAMKRLAVVPTILPKPLEGAATASALRSGRSWMVAGCASFTGSCSGVTSETFALAGDGWSFRATATWQARSYAALAYHEARDRLVLFGGATTNVTHGDTQLGTDDGTAVAWVAGAGGDPPARHSHAMVYDEARTQVVLFGGRSATAMPFGDTWVWDGGWTPRSPPVAPGARFGHAMTYDAIRRRVVLFGGTTNDATELLSDTWEWDGVTWTRHDVAGPTARRHARLAWNPARGRVVLAGGELLPGLLLSDVWEWDGSAWVELLPDASPVARGRHALLTATDGGGVVMYGGRTTSVLSDETWRLSWDSPGGFDDRCRDNSDNDRDALAGCDDPDCWLACSPFCAPHTSCDPAAPHCGDGMCGGAESCGLCPADCGACPPVCGDFTCVPPETAASCPGDCP
jgi:cysteine-rich repeat protein